MASVILYCKACGDGYASVGEVPRACPSCFTHQELIAPTELWTTTPPYRISRNDFKFLRSLRIDPEETPDDGA